MAEQVRKFNAKAVLSGFFAVVLAVGLAIPVSSAFASPADQAQAEADAALEQSSIKLAAIIRMLCRSSSMLKLK